MELLAFLFVLMFGALVGYAAAERRGFSRFAGVLGGMLLGPFSLLMFFVSGVTRGERAPSSAGRTIPAVSAPAVAPAQADGASSWLTRFLLAIVIVLAIAFVVELVIR